MLFIINIGDWSDDGHGKCEDIIFDVNKTTKEIREGWWNSKEKLGWAPSDAFAEYEERNTTKEYADKLNKLIPNTILTEEWDNKKKLSYRNK